MHILVIGDENNLNECRQKFGEGHIYSHQENGKAPANTFEQVEVVFDFFTGISPGKTVRDQFDVPVFVSTAKIRLADINGPAGAGWSRILFGFAGLPTFLNREILEVSLLLPEHRERLSVLCQALNTSFQVVEDRVGLVTPRVICMIINEAYYTVEEGIATRADIDTAMKLGTNYPFGPFEWCQKIGVDHVYEVLDAVHRESLHQRYKICPLLGREYQAAKDKG